jgi:hypothetical protein
MLRAFLLTVAALLSANAAFADETADRGSAPIVTIEQLLHSPSSYANKFVRVRGQVDNCFSLTCNLCPEDMTNESFERTKCLGLEFDGYNATARDPSADLEMEQAFRFSTLTLNTYFDAACLQGVCLDRSTVLLRARAEKVYARKSATTGIISWYDFGGLVEPKTETDRAAMVSALDEMDVLPSPSKFERRVFIISNPPISLPPESLGLGCVCTKEACDGQWPTHWFLGFESPANPYKCYILSKSQDGKWQLRFG